MNQLVILLLTISIFSTQPSYGESTATNSSDEAMTESVVDDSQYCTELRSVLSRQRQEISEHRANATLTYFHSISFGGAVFRSRHRGGNVLQMENWEINLTDKDYERIENMIRLDYPDLMVSFERNLAEYGERECQNRVTGCEDGMYQCAPGVCCPE